MNAEQKLDEQERIQREQDRRRLKLVYVSAEELMVLLNRPHHEWLAIPRFTELPPDYEVRGVDFDFRSNGFWIQVWHPSFDVAQPGYELPRLNSSPWIEEQTIYRRTPQHPMESVATEIVTNFVRAHRG